MHENYKIYGTNYINPYKDYFSGSLYPNFQEKFLSFKKLITENTLKSIPTSIYKFGDGDYYFLKKQSFGSAKPGKRALRKPYWMINHKKFVEESKKNDYYLCEIFQSNNKKFNEVFETKADFPAEFVYGLVANKWLFKQFSGKIGLIGAKEKIALIYELMKYNRYQEYLGIEKFEDYLTIPQKFACDNLSKTTNQLIDQLNSSTSQIFLVGVGHVKSGLLSQIKTKKNAVYLDIGSGIDALAGIIDVERPYFGDWCNFKLKDQSLYNRLDYLNYDRKGREFNLN